MTETSSAPPIFGETTKTLWDTFKSHAGSNGVLQHAQIRPLLNSIELFPTYSQGKYSFKCCEESSISKVYEMVHCACELSGRTPVDHITFGEFCIFVTELREHYNRNMPGSQPRSQLKEKTVQALEERRLQRRFSGVAARFQVLLGGSCNPTTWRHDIAIPFLKQNGISFYNPQVSNWRPELMEVEDQAKQTAEVLFFVVDNQTRSTASMVEAAYLAGCGRQLILIIKKFVAPVFIYGEEVPTSELEDLERSHAYLTDLVERMSIPVFSDVHLALNCTKKVVHESLKVADLTTKDGAQAVRFPHVRVAHELIKIKDVFKSYDSSGSGRLTTEDVCLAFKAITDEELPHEVLSTLKDKPFLFEDFCCLLSEHRYHRKSLMQRVVNVIYRLPGRLSGWLAGQSYRRSTSDIQRRRDLFLGGSCGVSKWRELIAIPILLRHGISYYNPQLEGWNTHYIPLEAALKDSCRLLLYVITEDTRAMTSMIEAGYFIGQGCNVILCLQNMKHGISIEGTELSHNSVDDYNRARMYLADLANRDGVPVLNNIEEAVTCAVRRLKEYGREFDGVLS